MMADMDTENGGAADAPEDAPVILDADSGEAMAEQGDAEPEPVPAAEAAALRTERDGLRDQLLRARAEFDNYRKRTAREMEHVRRTAAEDLIRELLPVLDNLERAVAHAEGEAGGLADGVRLVLKQFSDALTAKGLEPIGSVAQPFDPTVHEALAYQPSEEHPPETVMLEYQRGYRIADYVLRPAKVVVSSGPPVERNADAAASAEEEAASA